MLTAVLDDVPLAERLLDVEPEAIDVRVRPGKSHPHLGDGDTYVWALDFAETPIEVARRRGHERVYSGTPLGWAHAGGHAHFSPLLA